MIIKDGPDKSKLIKLIGFGDPSQDIFIRAKRGKVAALLKQCRICDLNIGPAHDPNYPSGGKSVGVSGAAGFQYVRFECTGCCYGDKEEPIKGYEDEDEDGKPLPNGTARINFTPRTIPIKISLGSPIEPEQIDPNAKLFQESLETTIITACGIAMTIATQEEVEAKRKKIEEAQPSDPNDIPF